MPCRLCRAGPIHLLLVPSASGRCSAGVPGAGGVAAALRCHILSPAVAPPGWRHCFPRAPGQR